MKKKNGLIDKSNILTDFDLRSPFAAAFYSLLSRLHILIREGSIKTLLFTSAVPEEGKSIVAVNLSLGFATLLEKNTLLIDANMPMPVIHEIFGLERRRGLSEILMEEIGWESALKGSTVERLAVLTSGEFSISASMLLDSERMGELIENIRAKFDIVLLDSPPVILSSDSLMLAPQVDGVVLIVNSEKTQREVVKKARELIEGAGAKILGVVLNKREYVIPQYVYGRLYGSSGYCSYYTKSDLTKKRNG